MTNRILQFTLCMLLASGISQAQNYQWAKQLGGTQNNETAGSVATDASGNVFVTGWFSGTVTIGSTTLTSRGGDDIYVAKLDSNGAVQWAFREGGTGVDRGYGIAVDATGNIYITGQIGGTDTFGTGTILVTNGLSDGYIAKYNNSAALQWAVNCGSTRGDRSNAIALDDSNNVYICGWFGQAGGGPPGGVVTSTINFGTISATGVGATDLFVAKANGSNGNWVWGVGTGSRNANTPDALNDIHFANNGVYVCGAFADTMAIGKNSFISTGSSDVFWALLTKQGILVTAGSIGTRQADNGGGLTSDPSGNIYISGVFNQTPGFGGGGGAGSMKVGKATINGTKAEAFVAGFDKNMNVKWASSYGDTSNESAIRISCDNNYNLYVGGSLTTVTTIGGTKYTSVGGNDVFLMALDTSGTVLWSKAFGTTNNEDIRDITSDSRGQYLVGAFGAAGGGGGGTLAFNGSVSITSAGGGDGYCVKLYNCPGISGNVTLSGSPNFCQSGSVTMTAAAGATSYQWYMNGSPINGITTDSHTVFSAGAYYCLLTNSSGCQINSATTTVNIGNPPTASLNTVATQICQGDSIIMTAGSGSNYKYKYYFNNAAVTGWVTTTTYFAKQAGDYKVEVDNFGCTAFSSTITMTTIATPTVTIKAIGSTNICVGDTVVLQSDTNSTWTYTWQRFQGGNYVAINGQNSDIFYCTAVGQFRMLVSTPSGCGVPSNSITITTSGPNNANLQGMPGNGTLCKGDSVTLQAGSGGGGGGITYQWYKDGNAIAGATNRIYRIKTSGTFKVTLTGGGCTVNSKDTVIAFINEAASVTPSGSAGLCPGDTLKFTATGDVGSTFSWFRNSNSIPGANTANYAATQTGNYSCVISFGTCNYQSPNVAVTLFPAAAVPAIVQNGNNLASSISGTSYTWYLNNTTVVGNAQFIYGWTSGFYKVVVADANGCKGESPLFSFSNNGISSASMERLNIYPNPSNGQVMLDLNTSEGSVITVSDMSGKRIYTETLKATNGTHSLDLSSHPQGLYIIQVQSGNRNFVNRIELLK